MTYDKSAGIRAWTAYWRLGRAASCLHGSDDEVKLSELWAGLVSELPDGARLLDLAAGAGAAARMCAAAARRQAKTMAIEAVDAADLDPTQSAPDSEGLLASVRFHPRVMLEALPFADSAFDAVISQFGFEYADEAPAAAEAARVLARPGRLRLAVHAREGAAAADIAERVRRLEAALAPDGVITLLRALAAANADGAQDAIPGFEARLRDAVERLRPVMAKAGADDTALYYANAFLGLWSTRTRYDPADLRRSIEDGAANAEGVLQRQAGMLRAARSEDDMYELGRRFAGCGMVVEPPRSIRDERRGDPIAWLLDARRPA